MEETRLTIQMVSGPGRSAEQLTVSRAGLEVGPLLTNSAPPRTVVTLDPHTAGVFCELLRDSAAYRLAVAGRWAGPLGLRLAAPGPCSLDWRGGALARAALAKEIEVEDALHWLSTLGGAYSNLG
jgi:hypothetical protein